MSEVINKKGLRNPKNITILVLSLVILLAIIILAVNIFTSKITTTSSGDKTTSSQYLYCTTKSTNIPDAFFDIPESESADQAIKVLFNNKKLDTIYYNASITYNSSEKATSEQARLRSRYGLYVQDNGKSSEIFSPDFSASGDTVHIGLYADAEKLDNNLAKIFLIDTSDNLSNYTSKVLSTLYKSKGFSCEARE